MHRYLISYNSYVEMSKMKFVAIKKKEYRPKLCMYIKFSVLDVASSSAM